MVFFFLFFIRYMTSNGCRCGLKKEKIRGWSGQVCGVLVSAGEGWRLFVDCLRGLGADMGSLIFFLFVV